MAHSGSKWLIVAHSVVYYSPFVLVITKSARYKHVIPAGIYLLKVNNRNTSTSREICLKLTTKIPEQRRRRSGIFIVNSEHVSHLVLVFLLLILNM